MLVLQYANNIDKTRLYSNSNNKVRLNISFIYTQYCFCLLWSKSFHELKLVKNSIQMIFKPRKEKRICRQSISLSKILRFELGDFNFLSLFLKICLAETVLIWFFFSQFCMLSKPTSFYIILFGSPKMNGQILSQLLRQQYANCLSALTTPQIYFCTQYKKKTGSEIIFQITLQLLVMITC